MDLFTALMFLSMDLEVQAIVREIENDNLLIPSWLFRETSQNQMRQQFGRIERRPGIQTLRRFSDYQSPTEDLPIIPDWMFQENDSQNESLYTGRRIGLAELASSYFISQYVQIYNRPENQSPRQRRCICGFCNLMEPVKITETKEKLIETGKNDECPITYDPINYGDAYLCCSECKYNFSEQAILKHLNGNSMKKECPMCRSVWKDYCKYINKDSLREKEEVLQQCLTLPKNNIKTPYTKDIYSYIGDVNKTRHNKKWFYGK